MASDVRLRFIGRREAAWRTASVRHMEEAARLLEGSAAFVDAAVMAPVPMNGLDVSRPST